MENRGDSKTVSTQGERLATLAAAEPDLTVSSSEHLSQQAGTIKKSTKSKLAHPFKTLREASLKLRRSGGKDSNLEDEMSQGAEYTSSSAGSTLERGVKSKKSKDKKKKNGNDDGVIVEHLLLPENTDESEDGKKKGKKKKGSSLVRKFSAKYRSNKSGGEETSPQAPRHGESVTASEISANDMSEDSQSLASNSTFASSVGARTPDQSPSHPIPTNSVLVEESESQRNVESSEHVTLTSDIKRISPSPPPRVEKKIGEEEEEEILSKVHPVLYQESAVLKAPKLIAMTTEVNKPFNREDGEEISPSDSSPTPPQIMEEIVASSLQDELNAAAAEADKTEIQTDQIKTVDQKEEFLDALQQAGTSVSPEVREIVFPAGLEDTERVENVVVASNKDTEGTTAQGGERREHLYKILVIGELGTGKTSIIKRYVHQFFSQHYRATIGVDFALKVLTWDQNTIIRLQLWDIAGQERFGNMTRVYYKEAVGAFIVFDVTRTATFDAVLKWKADLDSKVQLPDGSPIPCVLLANKCDQQKEGLVNSPAKMDEYCKEHGFSGWYETSAKENINIDEAARFLVTKILQNDKLANLTSTKDKDGFALDGTGKDDKGAQKSCAC